jgi:predicted MPP superfamily phosphohydrolase
MRFWRHLLGWAMLVAGFVVGYALLEARRDPVVRRAAVALSGWPAGARPVRVALLSDLHMRGLSMDGARLRRIVGQVNALHPDLVLIAGDFIQGRAADGAARQAPDLVAPLAALRAPLGVVAVPGNHDHWTGMPALRAALARAHVTLLENGAVARGPLAVAGFDDQYTRHAAIGRTMAALAPLPGAVVAFTHSPDLAPDLPGSVTLLLAGHTHCGQVVLPFWGPVVSVTRYGNRYLCGLVREGSRTVIVTAGLGTSDAPFRLGAPPDLWLVTLGPEGPSRG